MNKVEYTDYVSKYYLVIFIDILGQRESLRNIKSLPANNEEAEHFDVQILKTLGRVVKLRNAFDKYFRSANLYIPNTESIPPDYHQAFLSSQKPNIHYYGISDSIIIAVPLMDDNDDENCTPMTGVFSALVATSIMGLGALSDQIVFRAGMDVGVCTQIQDKEIYGPALERAYYLENKLAEYPRSVIGIQLLKYLDSIQKQRCKTPLGELAKTTANLCTDMITQDTDGRFMLDFLGKTAKEIFDGANFDVKAFIIVRDFVISEYKRNAKENNHKLASRYFRLMSYIDSRKELWKT
jgi:hypothetical protein